MDNVPKETETIAVKRTNRIASKVELARKQFGEQVAWWNNAIVEMLTVAFLFALTVFTVLPFFQHTLADIPFSGPVIPFLVKILEFFSLNENEATLSVLLVFYIFFPFSYYLFVRWITRRKLAAYIATLFISLPLFPFARTRIIDGLLGNDASHVASLTLVPLALYGILSFVRQGRMANLVIASVASAFVALTSPFSFFAFAFFAGVCTFSEILLGEGRLKIARLFTVIFFAASLCSFWYHPAFFYWMVVGPMGEDVRNVLGKLLPISFFTAPVLGVFGFLLFDRRENLQPLFLATFSTVVFALIVVAGGGFVPSHPVRYAAELGLSTALLMGVVGLHFLDALRLGKLPKIHGSPVLANVMIVLIVLTSLVSVILGQRELINEQQKVLGIWTDVSKGQIWKARDNFDGFSTLAGYAITATAIGALVYLEKNNKKMQVDVSSDSS